MVEGRGRLFGCLGETRDASPISEGTHVGCPAFCYEKKKISKDKHERKKSGKAENSSGDPERVALQHTREKWESRGDGAGSRRPSPRVRSSVRSCASLLVVMHT